MKPSIHISFSIFCFETIVNICYRKNKKFIISLSQISFILFLFLFFVFDNDTREREREREKLIIWNKQIPTCSLNTHTIEFVNRLDEKRDPICSKLFLTYSQLGLLSTSKI